MFVAVVPPAAAIDHLERFLDTRREAGDFRWVPAEQLHLTLAFMAEVPERKVDDLAERLERAARRRTAHPTRLVGGGAFPNVGRARVIWTGLELDEAARTEVGRLATGCRAAAAKAGIEVDGARFKPHLTLARTRHPHDVSNWVRLLDGYVGLEWTLDEVTLVSSYLGQGPRGRPRHEIVDTFPLASS
jgi:RNA 2',3'-cyclic 3'-phosphodiesterase